MAMSAWGLLAAPLFAAHAPTAAENPNAAIALAALGSAALVIEQSDVFGELDALDSATMSGFSGGEDTAIDIGSLGVNISDQVGGVSRTTTTNSVNGEIAGNLVSGNDGITTVFNNTGNGVIFQSSVNVNIFLGATPTGSP